MRYFLAALLLSFSIPALADKPVAPESVPGTTRVTAEQVAELILSTPKLVLIDSRHSEEYAKGHVEGAVNVLDADMTPSLLAKHVAKKDTPIVFYCNGERCLRSSNASRMAVEWGYKKIYWFRGGLAEWEEKKMPVTK